MAIDFAKLTLGEIATIERLSGLPFSAISEDDSPRGYVLASLVYVAKFREDSTFTWEKAQAFTITEATEFLGLGDNEDDDPKDEA